MRGLAQAIAPYIHRPDGGGPPRDVPDVAILRSRVTTVLRGNVVYFNLCIGFIVSLFIASIIIVITHLESPTLITAALGGFGIGSIGLVSVMLRTWREKVGAEVLLELALHFEGDQLKLVVNAFHRWMNPVAD